MNDGETVHNHGGTACDPNVCPNDKYCHGMQPLHYCVQIAGTEDDPAFECHHLDPDSAAEA